ncbi:MAG: hypothetical protein IJ578_08165 [Bacteroidales bacterium]|nr:hypothetical protein [Bacteroidales bacterium]
MKNWKEIENMSPEQLEQQAAGVEIPADLERRVGETLQVLSRTEEVLTGRSSRTLWLSAVGTAAAAALIAGLLLPDRNRLQDTYDDPALAYAEVERALGRIAEKMQYGASVVTDSREQMEKPLKMLE